MHAESDAGLQQELASAAEVYASAVISIAAQAGFTICADDVYKDFLGLSSDSISEDDLAGIAGGGWSTSVQVAPWSVG